MAFSRSILIEYGSLLISWPRSDTFRMLKKSALPLYVSSLSTAKSNDFSPPAMKTSGLTGCI